VTIQLDVPTHLEVTEILRVTEGGMTQPFLCQLSDGQLYVVKGKGATIRGLVCEAAAGLLGQAFGLPIPPFAFASIGTDILRHDRDAMASLGVGCGFASKYQSNIYTVAQPDIRNISLELLSKVYLFDYWIKNEDRTGTEFGGNSNLFINVSDSSLIVLDHNLAFDPNYNAEDAKRYHICREAWFRDPRWTTREALVAEMEKALKEVKDWATLLPSDWVEETGDLTNAIIAELSNFSTNEFWEPLL